MTSFNWRGHEITVAVMPYRIYLLQKIQDSSTGRCLRTRRLCPACWKRQASRTL